MHATLATTTETANCPGCGADSGLHIQPGQVWTCLACRLLALLPGSPERERITAFCDQFESSRPLSLVGSNRRR